MTEADGAGVRGWPAILTWRSHDASRIESARVQLSGNRIRAIGRIVAAATEQYPAFSASYDLVTDDAGLTRRLSLDVTMPDRDRQLSVARDEENMWLISGHEGESRADFGGALDVDVVLSPFFNALPIRRIGLHRAPGSVTLPLVYVRLPDLSVVPESISYSSSGAGSAIAVHSPVAEAAVVVDDEGFIIDYPGLAARI
ncbi:MAG: putative glycolipid-binding domain-containing protein [Mycobacterium sp.]